MRLFDLDLEDGAFSNNKKVGSSNSNIGETPLPTESHTARGIISPRVIDPVGHITQHLIDNVGNFNKHRAQLPIASPAEKVKQCSLYIFSPKKCYNHMVRPHIYNFNNPTAIDKLHQNYTNNSPLLNTHILSAAPEINGMILPANEGHTIDMNKMSDYWTFLLIVDSEQADGFQSYQTDARIRTMSTGFIIGEPVSLQTERHNPNAIFKFTHHTKFRYPKTRSGNYHIKGDSFVNQDVLPTEFKSNLGMSADDMVNLSPEFLQPVDSKKYAVKHLSNKSNMLDDDNMVLNVLEGISRQTPTKLKSENKNTKNHLYTLMSTLDSAKDSFESREDTDHRNISNTTYGYVNSSVSDMFYHKLETQKPMIESGITAFEVKTFSELDRSFPSLSVTVKNIKNPRNWDVAPSSLVSDNNTFNAWIADVVSCICESCGIMEMSFVYDTKGNQFQKEGRWKVEDISSVHGNDPVYNTELFKRFEKEMELHVFGLLRYLKGDFFLFVKYRIISDTIIQLKFYCDDEKAYAFYEHPSHLSGLVNPNVGDFEYAHHNAEEMQTVLDRFEID